MISFPTKLIRIIGYVGLCYCCIKIGRVLFEWKIANFALAKLLHSSETSGWRKKKMRKIEDIPKSYYGGVKSPQGPTETRKINKIRTTCGKRWINNFGACEIGPKYAGYGKIKNAWIRIKAERNFACLKIFECLNSSNIYILISDTHLHENMNKREH